MKSFDTDLKKYAEKTRLKAAERRELRERVLSYMEYHPLPKRNEPLPQIASRSDRFVVVHFNNLYMKITGGVFAILLLVVVPFMAEQSVPGDALYLVKTQVNEGIRAQLANSPYEKVTFETELIERRIAEARLLASEGKLTEEVQAQIALTVKGHANAAQSGLAEMRATNVDEAAIAEIAFDSALQVQSAVLDTNDSVSTTSSIAGILDVVNTVREEVVQSRGTSTPSYEGMAATIELETTRAYELFETVKVSATPEEITDIERRLSDIERLIAGAAEKRPTDDASAVADMVSALGLIQKLVVFMTDIDVRETVALETIVPIVLTLEERSALVMTTLEQVATLKKAAEVRIPLISDTALSEKIVFGMEQLTLHVAVATSSLEAQNIDTAEQHARDALALATDIDTLTSSAGSTESTLGESEVTTGETSTSTEPVPPTEGTGSEESEVNVEPIILEQ